MEKFSGFSSSSLAHFCTILIAHYLPCCTNSNIGSDSSRAITSFRLPGENPKPLKYTPPAWTVSQMHTERLPCNQLNWQNWEEMEACNFAGMVSFALPTKSSLLQLWVFSISLFQFSPHPTGEEWVELSCQLGSQMQNPPSFKTRQAKE